VVIEKVLGEHESLNAVDLDEVLEADGWARRRAATYIEDMRN